MVGQKFYGVTISQNSKSKFGIRGKIRQGDGGMAFNNTLEDFKI